MSIVVVESLNLADKILTSVAQTASVVEAGLVAEALGVHGGQGWPWWEAERSLKHCLGGQHSASGGSARAHQQQLASEGTAQLQKCWPARLEPGTLPLAWYEQWWDIQLISCHPAQMRKHCITSNLEGGQRFRHSATVNRLCRSQEMEVQDTMFVCVWMQVAC